MERLQIIIPDTPCRKAVAGAILRENGAKARNFLCISEQSKKFERKIREEYGKQQKNTYFETENISLFVKACFPLPDKASKKQKAEMLSGNIRPDEDMQGICMVVTDGLYKTMFRDKKQIVSISGEKIYAEKPETIIIVEVA